MNPASFITIAEVTAPTGPEGARSSVSRAYYGAYHLALAALEAIGVTMVGNGTSHVKTAQCFQQMSNENASRAGNLLGDLHSRRLEADYKLKTQKQESKKEADLAILQAKKVEQELGLMLSLGKSMELKEEAIKICDRLGVRIQVHK